MSLFSKQGMSVIRIIAIVLFSIAIILQVVAVAADKWSEIDANYHSLPIKAFQNLWTETVLLDKPFAYPQPQNMDVGKNHKMNIVNMYKDCFERFFLAFFKCHVKMIVKRKKDTFEYTETKTT